MYQYFNKKEDRLVKRAYGVISVVVLFTALFCTKANAGTFLVGAKYWWVMSWDSAILAYYDKGLCARIVEAGLAYNSESDAGSGYLAGPVFGYQTSNRVWSISFAPMMISDFSEKLNANAWPPDEQSNIYPINTDIKLQRQDYDLAVSYSLFQFKDSFSLLEYCKLFAGIKYETVKADITSTISNPVFNESMDYKYDLVIPAVGVGVVYPFTDKFFAGIQGGLGLAIISSNDFKADNTVSYNAEVNLDYMPIEKLILQLGFKYQRWDLKTTGSDAYSGTYADITYGPTLSCAYAF
jgi:hypothetical protein